MIKSNLHSLNITTKDEFAHKLKNLAHADAHCCKQKALK